jgi:hypothetical protein
MKNLELDGGLGGGDQVKNVFTAMTGYSTSHIEISTAGPIAIVRSTLLYTLFTRVAAYISAATEVASSVGVLVEEAHDVRLARIELEPFDLHLEVLPCKAPLDLGSAELRCDTGFRPRAHPPVLFGIPVPGSIDCHAGQLSEFSTAQHVIGRARRNHQPIDHVLFPLPDTPSPAASRERHAPPVACGRLVPPRRPFLFPTSDDRLRRCPYAIIQRHPL